MVEVFPCLYRIKVLITIESDVIKMVWKVRLKHLLLSWAQQLFLQILSIYLQRECLMSLPRSRDADVCFVTVNFGDFGLSHCFETVRLNTPPPPT